MVGAWRTHRKILRVAFLNIFRRCLRESYRARFGERFERSASRLHDLRATFVTMRLANGKIEWVTDRTGHRSSQMLSEHAHRARTWAELGLGTPEDLDRLRPEFGTEPRGLVCPTVCPTLRAAFET